MSYTFIKAGSSFGDIETLGIPIDKKVYFAGEHTSVEFPATTHGAYLSGLRAAN